MSQIESDKVAADAEEEPPNKRRSSIGKRLADWATKPESRESRRSTQGAKSGAQTSIFPEKAQRARITMGIYSAQLLRSGIGRAFTFVNR